MFGAYIMMGIAVAGVTFVPPLIIWGATSLVHRPMRSITVVKIAAGLLFVILGAFGFPANWVYLSYWGFSALIFFGAMIVFVPVTTIALMRSRNRGHRFNNPEPPPVVPPTFHSPAAEVRVCQVGTLDYDDIGLRIDLNEPSYDQAELRIIIHRPDTVTITVADTDNPGNIRRHTLDRDDVVVLWRQS